MRRRLQPSGDCGSISVFCSCCAAATSCSQARSKMLMSTTSSMSRAQQPSSPASGSERAAQTARLPRLVAVDHSGAGAIREPRGTDRRAASFVLRRGERQRPHGPSRNSVRGSRRTMFAPRVARRRSIERPAPSISARTMFRSSVLDVESVGLARRRRRERSRRSMRRSPTSL